MNTQICPEFEELKALLSGTVSDEAFDTLAEHLESCSACAETCAQISSDDTLSTALRTADTGLIVNDERLGRIQQQLVADSLRVSMDTDATVLDDCATATATVEDLSFLADDENGKRLGKYQIDGILGSGGMGIVLAATDPDLGRRVAIKVMKPRIAADAEARERFLREARAMAEVQHDNIVAIFGIENDDTTPYVVMPLLNGQSLASRLNEEAPLTIDEALTITEQVTLALQAAHQRQLLHRDVKPDNIWLDADTGRIRLLDFGLARRVEADRNLTGSGAIVGTPNYLAPEQVDGRELDSGCDLFSLGVVLYEMITGFRPFERNTLMRTLDAVRHDAADSAIDLNEQIPPAVAELCERLLSKNPADRPDSADEVLAEIQRIRGLTTRPQPALQGADGGDTTEPPRRKLLTAALCGGVAVLLGILLRIQTPDGTVEIDVPEELWSQVQVTFTNDGQPVIASETEGWKVKLDDGDWVVAVQGEGQFEINPSTVRIKDGNSQTVTIRKIQSSVVVTAKSPTPEQADDTFSGWLEATQQKSGFARYSAMLAELKNRNSKAQFKLQRTENPLTLTLTGDRLADIRPLLVAKDVEAIHYDELRPKEDAAVLRELTHLKTINNRSAESYRAVFADNPNAVPVDEAWLEAVKGLQSLEQKCLAVEEKLRELNPAFDGRLTYSLGYAGIQNLALQTDLITDISPLAALDSQYGINLSDSKAYTAIPILSSWLTDISALDGKHYTIVNIAGTYVSDLSPLHGMRIRNLYARYTPINSFAGLENSPLEGIEARLCERLTDLSALSGKSSLVLLEIAGSPVQDLSPLANTSIRELDLRQCQNITDLTPLHDLPLQGLNLHGTSALSLVPLRNLSLTAGLPLPETVPLHERYHFIRRQKELANRDSLLEQLAMQLKSKYAHHRKAAELIVSHGGTVRYETLLSEQGQFVDLTADVAVPEETVFRLHTANLKEAKLTEQDITVLNRAFADSLESLYLPKEAADAASVVTHIGVLPELTELFLSAACPARDLPVGKFPNLVELGDIPEISAAGCQRLRQLSQLEFLGFSMPRCSPGDMRSMLKALPRLTHLQLAGGNGNPEVNDEMIAAVIEAAPQLQKLGLEAFHDITDAALQAIGRSKLTALGLSRCPTITDAGVAHLKTPPLDYLGLRNNERLTEVTNQHLAEFKTLTWLAIGPNIGDEDLVDFGKLPNLTHLNISGAQVTNEGLAELAKMKLFYLVAELPNIDDGAIPHIKQLKHIDHLILTNTGISESGLAELRPHLPQNGVIERRARD